MRERKMQGGGRNSFAVHQSSQVIYSRSLLVVPFHVLFLQGNIINSQSVIRPIAHVQTESELFKRSTSRQTVASKIIETKTIRNAKQREASKETEIKRCWSKYGQKLVATSPWAHQPPS